MISPRSRACLSSTVASSRSSLIVVPYGSSRRSVTAPHLEQIAVSIPSNRPMVSTETWPHWQVILNVYWSNLLIAIALLQVQGRGLGDCIRQSRAANHVLLRPRGAAPASGEKRN